MKKQLLFLIALLAIILIHTHTRAQTPTLWGLALEGGRNSNGTIFSFNTANNQPTLAYTFNTATTDASGTNGSLIKANNGLLYGTSYGGGTSGVGTIFSFNISTATEKVLIDFDAAAAGTYPSSPLIQATDSLLYGTTFSGGTYFEGVVYSFNITSGKETVLHNLGHGTDAAYPGGGLFQLNDSLLYGVSQAGGTNGKGTIYKLNILTGNETVVYSFGSKYADGLGEGSDGELIQATDGLIYGTTYGGGLDTAGTIFSFNTATGVETAVHSFGNGTDGSSPPGGLIQATDSLLFGTTYRGGVDTLGTIYSYNIYTHKETDVHDFGSGTDGKNPYYGPLLKASNGLIYGMTSSGGANGYGTIFSYNLTSNTEMDLYDFNNGALGIIPKGGFVEDDVATGIEQLSVNNEQLSVFPNPSTGLVTITSSTNMDELKVTNLLGQLVYQSYPKQTQTTFDLNGDGIYFVTVTSDNESKTQKLVVGK